MKFLPILLIVSGLMIACEPAKQVHEELTASAETLLNQWHQSIAQQDSNAVFSVLSNDFHYFGTDSFENWNKQAFTDFAMPLFKEGRSWDFTPTHTECFQNENSVWCYQMLETWMGPCRGTAVLGMNSAHNLEIHHFHLSFTVPNDQMRSVIELIKSNQ